MGHWRWAASPRGQKTLAGRLWCWSSHNLSPLPLVWLLREAKFRLSANLTGGVLQLTRTRSSSREAPNKATTIYTYKYRLATSISKLYRVLMPKAGVALASNRPRTCRVDQSAKLCARWLEFPVRSNSGKLQKQRIRTTMRKLTASNSQSIWTMLRSSQWPRSLPCTKKLMMKFCGRTADHRPLCYWRQRSRLIRL